MSINIESKPEFNVVNVGEELTQDQINALNASAINGSPTATNPYLTRTNTFNTTDVAVRITQEGTGDTFRVEDSASTDNSPFVISGTGTVGIGVAVPSSALDINSGIITRRNLSCLHASSAYTANNVEFNEHGSGVNLLVTSTSTATGDAVRITNLGSGNSFVVEDDTNPDATPFVITAGGNVGIGVTTTTSALEVLGRTYLRNTSGGAGNPVAWVRQESTGSSAVALTITNQGTGNSFVVEDENPDSNPFVIDASGNVAIGATTSGGRKLSVTGTSLFTTTSSGITGEFVQSGTGLTATFTNTATATSDCVRITNNGSGNSFVVEDAANPDSSPFVIAADGRVGIGGIVDAAYPLKVIGGSGSGGIRTDGFCLIDGSSASIPRLTVTQSGNGGGVVITNTGTGNSFVVEDASSETTPFVINNAGDVKLGGSLTFSDNTVQTTAASPFSTAFPLDFGNTANEFASFYKATTTVTLELGSVGGSVIWLRNTGITFPDSTLQTSAPVYSASTSIHGGGGGNIQANDYPHEIRIVIAGVTYAMPARAI